MQSKTLTFSAFIALFTVACGGFAPAEGTWDATDAELTTNACNLDEEAEDTVMSITLDDEGQVILDGDTSDAEIPPFVCSLEDKKLNCNSFVDSEAGEGSTVTFSQKLGGTFVDEETLEGEGRIGFDCEGEMCDVVAEFLGVDGFPCESTFTFTGTHRADR